MNAIVTMMENLDTLPKFRTMTIHTNNENCFYHVIPTGISFLVTDLALLAGSADYQAYRTEMSEILVQKLYTLVQNEEILGFVGQPVSLVSFGKNDTSQRHAWISYPMVRLQNQRFAQLTHDMIGDAAFPEGGTPNFQHDKFSLKSSFLAAVERGYARDVSSAS